MEFICKHCGKRDDEPQDWFLAIMIAVIITKNGISI